MGSINFINFLAENNAFSDFFARLGRWIANHLTLVILVISTGIFLIIVVFFFILMKVREKKYHQVIKEESNTIRIYIIDVKKRNVTYFTRSDMTNKHTSDLDSFYAMFNVADISRLRNWIFKICEDISTAPRYIEADMLDDNTHKDVFSLLRLIDYKPQYGIIHLEMQLLNFITPMNKNIEMKKTPQKGGKGVTTMLTMNNIINKSRSTKGYTFAIRLSILNKVFSENEQEKLMMLKIKDQVYPFAYDSSHPRHLIELNSQELVVVDLKIDDRREAYQLASSMAKMMKKVIAINDYGGKIKFGIGLVENMMFYHNFGDIVSHAQEASLTAIQDDHEIYCYERILSTDNKEDVYRDRSRDQIEKLISSRHVKCLFRPIVDVEKESVFGYLETAKTYGTSFASYNEMVRYASMLGKNRELFNLVAKTVIPKYADESPNLRIPLFFRVSIHDFENIKTILPTISRIEKVKLILMFDEQEISQNSGHILELKNELESLKSLGYRLAMEMKDKNLLLDTSFYRVFDYFVAGTSMTGEIKKNNIKRLSIRTLIESLLKYNKPIIATGLEGWQSVELMIKSGVNYVSSEVISPSNEMILPVEKKKMQKIAEFSSNGQKGRKNYGK